MQPNTQHADIAYHASRHTPHEPAPKPRASMPAARRPSGRNRVAGDAEGKLIRAVGRLAIAAKADPAARAAHGYFVNGYLAALAAHHLLPADRVTTVRQACTALLDGDITPQDIRAMQPTADTDPTYLRAIGLVRRAGTADIERLASELSTVPAEARAWIERMQADGIVHAPDLFGVRTVAVMEVSHG